jgi:predicted flap endonuclease-1-like 5' DNA nuclease
LNPILLLLGALALVAVGYALARWRAKSSPPPAAEPVAMPLPAPVAAPVAAPPGADPIPAAAPAPSPESHHAPELARLVRSLEAESASLRQRLADREAGLVHAAAFAEDRRRLFSALAQSRAETARYRQLVVDIENNAPPVLFGTAAPDDLKLIVGVGPVLERMLHQLGVTSYRDIARWSERDIDEFDARLAEFPGRIRRDGWVTQARALHQSKYGEALGGGARR